MPAPTAVFRYLLVGLPAAFLLTAGARLYTLLHERSDIWWTPPQMLVPFTQSHDRVAIYVHGSELNDLLAAGQLRLVRDSTVRVVTAADIGLRLNNWDRVRAERIPILLVSALSAGGAAALLLVGLIILAVGGPIAGRSAAGQP